MWDSRSDFMAQSSAWCGLSTLSGSGFLLRAGSSAGGFRRSDPGLRRWQSMYHLEPESPTRSFSPLGAELWASRGERSFRQAERVPWLQDAHERLNTKLDRLRTREFTLGYNKTTAQMLDMEQKLLSETSALRQDAGKIPRFDRSRQSRELQEKVLKSENKLLDLRSSLENVSEDQSTCLRPPFLHSTSLKTAGDMTKEEIKNLREALREAEARASTLQEERNKALQDLHTSAEMQKMLINQMDDIKKRVSVGTQGHSEGQNQESESNSSISQACLENEKLRQELEVIMEHLATSQRQLQELNEEKIQNSRQITDLEAERSQLLREKKELLGTRDQDGDLVSDETKGNNSQRSKSAEESELENQKLQNRCLCLEEKLSEKEKMLQRQEETYQEKDEMRILHIKELEGIATHWMEKWQNVALTLQSKQDELEELKVNNTNDKRASEPGSRSEACKQEKGKDAFLFVEHKGAFMCNLLPFAGSELMQTLDKETQTDFSESCLIHEPPPRSPSNKSTQVWRQSGEEQRLKQKLAETERKVSERENDLRTMERLREMERTEAQFRISALELKLLEKASGCCHNGGSAWTDVSNPASIHAQQDEKQQPNSTVLHEQPTQRQTVSPGKNEKLCVEDKRNKTMCPVNPEVEQQRRLVTEQLKSLFKEREGKEAGRFAETQETAPSGSSSLPDWTPSSLVVKAAADRRNWHQGSALMPVLEEDEENSDLP
ncbi:unconventional myosin-XVIIIa-like [Fundulus heteroclitus]|uniref:unconventional myosin-XVIIIa-like n=1 Tax=Fundulus heteroclitus TaxID=8078 RepID=UPI00165C0548|nr:unconventional myosin-XVIIIa-like [Fundulus heteroclitus]